MDAGKGKSRDFGLSQALANQVVRRVSAACPVFAVFSPRFARCFRLAEIGQPVYLWIHLDDFRNTDIDQRLRSTK